MEPTTENKPGWKTSELGIVLTSAGTLVATLLGAIPKEHVGTSLIVFGSLGGLYLISRTVLKALAK